VRLSLGIQATATVLTGSLGVVLVGSVLQLPRDAAGLTRTVGEELTRSGATHAVTAVLLDFRAYDTLLEVGVLLLAALGALAVRRSVDLRDIAPLDAPGPVLAGVTRVVFPMMVLSAGYLLWLGTHAPGGAFQAGAVLAAAAILVLFTGGRSITALGPRALAALLAAGFIGFLAVAWPLLGGGRRLLDYPPSIDGTLIVLIELAVAIGVAVGLAGLFAAARQRGDDR
jgi:multisubunit Na+/H+ antiporter MnhB subunit